jgi:hypothetical protein
MNPNSYLMNIIKSIPRTLTLALIVIALGVLHSCAGMGSMRGDDSRMYYQSMDKMIDISRSAIENKGYGIINLHQRRETPRRTTITFANRSTAGQQMVSSMQSNLHLAEVDTADAVVVRIDNPDYDFGVPTDQRIDYAQLLFEEIDELLEQ